MQPRNDGFTQDDIDRKLHIWVNGSVDEYLESKADLGILKNFCLDSHPESKDYKDIGEIFPLQPAFITPTTNLLGNHINPIYDEEIIYIARIKLYQRIVAEMKRNLQDDNEWEQKIQKKLTHDFETLVKNRQRQPTSAYLPSLISGVSSVLFAKMTQFLFNQITHNTTDLPTTVYARLCLLTAIAAPVALRHIYELWPQPPQNRPLLAIKPEFKKPLISAPPDEIKKAPDIRSTNPAKL